MEKTYEVRFPFGLVSALGLIFITLKLVGVIDWSWWWVLAPFWIPWAFVLLVFLIIGVLSVIVSFQKKRARKRARSLTVKQREQLRRIVKDKTEKETDEKLKEFGL